MPSQPLPHVGVPVRGVVIRDQVKAQMLGRAAVDELQELQPFAVMLARLAHRDRAAIQRVERRKQRGGAMPLVVLGDGSGATALHRRTRLGAVQSLDLASLADGSLPVRLGLLPCAHHAS